MLSLENEPFNKTLRIQNPVFCNANNPEMKYTYGKDLSIIIKRNELGTLCRNKDFINVTDDIERVSIKIAVLGNVSKRGLTPIVILSGVESSTQAKIEITMYDPIHTNHNLEVLSIKYLVPDYSDVGRCDVHYLYNNQKYAEALQSRAIQVSLPDSHIEIHGESFQNTPLNLNSLSISYPIKFLEDVPKIEKDYHDSLLVGFLFGGPLTNTGYTVYDGENNVVEIYYCNPRDAEILQASKASIPPFNKNLNIDKLEYVFNQVLSKNLLSLSIGDRDMIMALLYRIWGGYLLYLDMRLILIYSGLEIFMKGWCDKLSLSDKQTEIISKDEFNKYFSEEKNALHNKIKNCDKVSKDEANALLTNLGQLHINQKKEKLERLYPLVGISLTDDEIAFTKLRHEETHELPYIPDTDEDTNEYEHANRAGIDLCYRTLLTFLGYEGNISPHLYKNDL